MVRSPALPADLKRCVRFHGHLCPGLVVGYLASKLALRRLGAGRSVDEELVAIVENDTCAADAVQVLTGCTFGKGNFFFRDYGKMVFTFAVRPEGRFVRLYFRRPRPAGIDTLPEEERRERMVRFMLDAPARKLFAVREGARAVIPEPAKIRESIPCDRCGESVMSSRIRRRDGKKLCVPCAGASRGR